MWIARNLQRAAEGSGDALAAAEAPGGEASVGQPGDVVPVTPPGPAPGTPMYEPMSDSDIPERAGGHKRQRSAGAEEDLLREEQEGRGRDDAFPVLTNTLEKFVVDTSGFLSRAEEQRDMMRTISAMGVDVSDICSPLRVSSMAERIELKPGFAVDLSVIDPQDGMPWDL